MAIANGQLTVHDTQGLGDGIYSGVVRNAAVATRHLDDLIGEVLLGLAVQHVIGVLDVVEVDGRAVVVHGLQQGLLAFAVNARELEGELLSILALELTALEALLCFERGLGRLQIIAYGNGAFYHTRGGNSLAIFSGVGDQILGRNTRVFLDQVRQGVLDLLATLVLLDEYRWDVGKGVAPVVARIEVVLVRCDKVSILWFARNAILVGLDDLKSDLELLGLLGTFAPDLCDRDVGCLRNHLVGNCDVAGSNTFSVVGVRCRVVVNLLLDNRVLKLVAVCILCGKLIPDVGRPFARTVVIDADRVANATDIFAGNLFLASVCVDAIERQLDASRRTGLVEVVAVALPDLCGRNEGVLSLNIGSRPGGEVGHGGNTNVIS